MTEKLEKAQIAEEKRRTKAAAKEARQEELEQKRLRKQEAQLTKQANQQLQNDYKVSRKATKPPQAHSTTLGQVVDEQSVVEVVELPQQQNRRGRTIKLPDRYCN